jgi:hypothetical protein
MEKIRMVGITCGGESISDVLLDIHFMNGQTVIIPLGDKARDPCFIALFQDERLFSPQTDGECVYWPDGSRLSCAEILNMVRGGGG